MKNFVKLFMIDQIVSSKFFFQFVQGIKLDNKGHIVVDEFQNTTGSKIYALGDVCGKALLTPGK